MGRHTKSLSTILAENKVKYDKFLQMAITKRTRVKRRLRFQNMCLTKLKGIVPWVGFFDPDEFFVGTKRLNQIPY